MRSIIAVIVFSLAPPLWAHCDSMKGPVVAAAQLALAGGDVTPVLKWVRPADEQQIRDAFARTMKVRVQSAEAKDLADRWFFETVVRVHRAGEGVPFDGLKGPEYKPERGIELADQAIESGSIDAAEKAVINAVTAGMRQRFHEVTEAQAHANDNIESGRRYVQTYVEFIHFVERLHEDAGTLAGHHEASGTH